MSFLFNCPACSTSLNIEEELVGTQMDCPACDNAFIVTAPVSGDVIFKEDELVTVSLIDSFLERIKPILSELLIEPSLKWSGIVGGYAHLAWGGVALLTGVIAAIKFESMQVLGGAFFVLLLSVLTQYISSKFITACELQLSTSESQLTSKSLTDCISLVLLLISLLFFCSGVYMGIKNSDFRVFLTGSFSSVGTLYLASVCLDPEALNIRVSEDASTGQEAIGILTFFMKVGLRLQPLFYVLSAVGAVIVGVIFTITLLKGNPNQEYAELSLSCGATASLLPLVFYLQYVFYYLFVDLLRAALSLPEKLDKIANKR